MTEEAAQPRADDLFAARLRQSWEKLSPSAKRVARHIDANRAAVLASSAREIAAGTRTSDATVVRTVQQLGFGGLMELKQALVAALHAPRTPADDMRRTLDDVGENTARAVDLVLDAHSEALERLRSPGSRAAIVAAVGALNGAERIAVFGIGPSAPLAACASVLLQRAGRRSLSLNATGIMLADQLLDLRQDDAVLAMAHGRAYREVLTVFAEAKRLGLPVVLITDSEENRLTGDADVVLTAPRGRAGRVALHGGSLIALEAVVLGLAAAGPHAAMAALERLNDLRQSASGQRHDVG